MRSHLAKVIVGLAVTLCWLPYGIQAGASSNRSDQPITADNAAQILAVTLRTAASEGSCSDFTSSVTAGESFGDRLKSWPEQIKSFYNDVRTEMRKVTAPSWREVRGTTAVVVVTVFIFGVYFFIIDNVIQRGVTFLYSYFGSH